MKCKNCGKVFDYEKYYGICPKCGTFQKQEKSEQEAKENPEVKIGFDTEAADSNLYTYVEDGTAAPRGKTEEKKPGGHKGAVVYGCVCVAVLLLCGLLSVLCEQVQAGRLKQEAALTELAVEEVPAGEPAKIGTRTITVLGTRLLEQPDVRPEFPKGQMCVAVHLQVENEEEYPSYETSLEAPYLAYADADGNAVFKEAVSSYDFSGYEVYYGLSLLESYDFSYEQEAEGDVVFFVEPGVSRVRLCLEDRYRPNNRMQVLKAVYELPVELPAELPGEVEE